MCRFLSSTVFETYDSRGTAVAAPENGDEGATLPPPTTGETPFGTPTPPPGAPGPTATPDASPLQGQTSLGFCMMVGAQVREARGSGRIGEA